MHINDFSTSDALKLSIEELKGIEGTESMISTLEIMGKFALNCKNTIPYLAKNFNWYIEPSIKITVLKELFKVYSDENKIDDILIKYYKENTNRIHDDLKKHFPNRKEIIDELFHAHNNRLYYLSCITFMTQIDGVVHDTFDKKNYFAGERNNHFFKQTLEKINSIKEPTVGTIFLKQLFNDELPIKLNPTQRKDNYDVFNHLNRHQIIHGETMNFNTEINSLKSLSLLASLAFNLNYLDDIYTQKGTK